MATKKTVKKTEPKKTRSVKKVKAEKAPVISEELDMPKEAEEIKIKEEKNNLGKYFYAVGRRKTSIAQVRLFVSDKKENSIEVNKKELEKYFSLLRLQTAAKASFAVTGDKKFFVSVHVMGGGIMGQAEAIRLGIARALVKYNEELKKPLKDLGFLTRDARVVERKKPGKLKARRSPQWAKR
jgi:small subunit ribosomal protein S9